MIYHRSAVESQRRDREEIAMLTAITMNGKLGEYLSKSKREGRQTPDRVDESPDIEGFRSLCGAHFKKSSSKET